MIRQKTISGSAWAELLVLAGIWAGSFAANRFALDGLPVLTTVALRVGGACLLLWAYVLATGLAMPRSLRLWGAFLGLGLLNNALPFSLIVWGQQSVPSGLAAIVNASTAIFAVAAAALAFRDEVLTARRLAGAVLGFAGVATAIGLHNLAAFDPTALPQLALVGAAVSYACAGVWARRTLAGVKPQVAATGMLTCSTLVMVPPALWFGGLPPAGAGLISWLAVLYLAAVATAGAYLLYYRLLAQVGVGNLGLVTLLSVPFAILLGALLLNEALPPRAFAGFALIAAGMALIDGRLFARKDSA